jgi:hypothetical protein
VEGGAVIEITTTAEPSAVRLRAFARAIQPELRRERAGLAQLVAARMRLKAPKGARSTLVNSIRAEEVDADTHLVKPHAAHAYNVEKGRKPGKGLPRFFDPSAAGAVAWLAMHLRRGRIKANPKYRAARLGSRRRGQEEMELRDAYMAWSRAVKFRGIKAQPFVKPTADEMQAPVVQGLIAAVQRAAQRLSSGSQPAGGAA